MRRKELMLLYLSILCFSAYMVGKKRKEVHISAHKGSLARHVSLGMNVIFVHLRHVLV